MNMIREAHVPIVLIADDDPDIQDLVAFRLERSGVKVLRAADGEKAYRLAVEHVPDLAVLDVSMPGLDGFELTRRLRAEPTTAAIPIILLTAKAQERDVEMGLAAGANDYIKKPFSPSELGERVSSILDYAA